MAVHLTEHRKGFGPGLTWVTRLDDRDDPTGIALGVLRLGRGARHEESVANETAFLLMEGRVTVELAGKRHTWARGSLFSELPHCAHLSAGERVVFHCDSDVELTVYSSANRRRFAPRVFAPSEVRDEPRGKGQVGDTCWRYVRTIFDRTNSDAAAELVLGEVVTLPGRWSSYPPHHHPQPEMYHYRFDKPQGYGHAELGEAVLKVKHGDTVKIFAGNDHAQAAAPGYAMYYAWVIRHLPDAPYTVPEFTVEHRWVMDPGAPYFRPQGDGRG
jgi:5-deoxy-glucuronate isomerase